jgi:hypothetical protein
VGGVDQLVQVFLGAEVGVDAGEVARPVAVEAVGLAGAFVGGEPWICSTGGVIQIASTPRSSK